MNLRLFTSTRWLFAILALLLAGQAIPAGAQLVTRPTWRKVGLEARTAHAMAFDERRGRLVLFGGMGAACALGDTWEYDGTTWLACPVAAAPAARYGHAMAYDSDRGVMVLFGGVPDSGTMLFNDTWEWNGSAWTHRTPANSPPARNYHAMAYDRARKRVVLFGGLGLTKMGTVSYNDTWEWDGTNWTQRTPSTAPSARESHAMAYDSARQCTILFGGINTRGMGNRETWQWDGNNWSKLNPPLSPPATFVTSSVSMAYDGRRGRTILGIGNSAPGACSLWEWDGAAWSQKAATLPAECREQALAYDTVRGHTLLFGGSTGNYIFYLNRFAPTALWAWDGSAWTQRLAPVSMHQVAQLKGAYDAARGRTVAVGAYDGRTTGTWWEWDGTFWNQRHAPNVPAERTNHAMGYDRQRKRVVLFGGASFATPPLTLRDTWELDGAGWTLRTPALSPPMMFQPSMTYDANRQRIILYSADYARAETWAWDGTAWSRLNVALEPKLGLAAMAYDPASRRVLLFGENNPNGGSLFVSETWAWNGSIWTKLNPAHSPSPRQGAAMAWDEARGRIVLFGGSAPINQFYNDVWEWDGTDWTALNIPSPPLGRAQAVMVYDSARRRFLVFGGAYNSSTGQSLNYLDTWELIFPIPPRTAVRTWANYP